jgi:hypothetical protein
MGDLWKVNMIGEPQMAIKNADDFIAFMDEVWKGGELYDEWHNAIDAAKRIGFEFCGPTNSYDGVQPWYVYRLPGAADGVRIAADGSMILPARPRRRPKAIH